MAVATRTAETERSTDADSNGLVGRYVAAVIAAYMALRTGRTKDLVDESVAAARRGTVDDDLVEQFRQDVGAGMIVGMAVTIGAGGIVLNQMSGLDLVANSSGVVDVSSIFQTAGTALVLLSIAMIVGAAAVIMGFFGSGGGF
jgi:hypothetical protein